MQFIFPVFLSALAVLAIPVIIHLFYFRKFKKVYFTNVRFLKELKEETSSRSRLRNLLVLLMRLLAFALLVFAFAQPFFTKEDVVDTRPRVVSIFVDNSFSMQALSQDFSLMERAKQRALQVIDAYDDRDRFHIITQDLEGRHMRLVDKNTATGFIEEIEISPASHPISLILERQKGVLEDETDSKAVYFHISDFQKSMFEDNFVPENLEMSVVPMVAVQERNLSIDSAWFDMPVLMQGQVAKLLVRIRNFDQNPAENIRLSVDYGGEKKPVGSVTVPEGGFSVDTINLNISGSGWQHLTVEITDYPVQFDDTYYLAFEVPEKIQILALYEQQPNRFLDAAFKPSPQYELIQTDIRRVDYSALNAQKMIILSNVTQISSGLAAQMSTVIREGTNLMLFPAKNADIGNINRALSTLGIPALSSYETATHQVSVINESAYVFSDIFDRRPANMKLPQVQGRFKFQRGSGESLLSFRDGNPFLVGYPVDKGTFFLFSTALTETESNLGMNAEVFVPFLYKAALQSSAKAVMSYTIGNDEQIVVNMPAGRGDVIYKMKGPAEFIPGVVPRGSAAVIQVFNQVEKAGAYQLFANERDTMASIAFNYNRKESNPEAYSTEELSTYFPNATILDQVAAASFTELIKEKNTGTVLWRICLILALLFLLLEVLFLRFWKV